MKLWIRLLLAVVMTGFIVAVLVYKLVYNKPHPDYEKEKATYTLSAQELYHAFKQNKDQASPKYSGQVIEVDGTISKIEEADTLVIVAFIFEQGDFGDEGVRVTMLPDFKDKARQLPPGTALKLKGLCTGYNDTDVILEKGSIVE